MELNKLLLISCAELDAALSPQTRSAFITTDFADISHHHFGYGTWIRNHFLRTDTALYNAFVRCGVSCKDDMSSFLLKFFYLYLREGARTPPTA